MGHIKWLSHRASHPALPPSNQKTKRFSTLLRCTSILSLFFSRPHQLQVVELRRRPVLGGLLRAPLATHDQLAGVQHHRRRRRRLDPQNTNTNNNKHKKMSYMIPGMYHHVTGILTDGKPNQSSSRGRILEDYFEGGFSERRS